METLNKILGITTLSSLTKHLTSGFNGEIDIDCIRVDNKIRVYWAINDNLYSYRLSVRSVNEITNKNLIDLIKLIEKTKK